MLFWNYIREEGYTENQRNIFINSGSFLHNDMLSRHLLFWNFLSDRIYYKLLFGDTENSKKHKKEFWKISKISYKLFKTVHFSGKLFFCNSVRGTTHYKRLFRETEKQRNRLKNAGNMLKKYTLSRNRSIFWKTVILKLCQRYNTL